MAKGQNFERRIATELSLWWTEGRDDDTIWRSSMSGGRATVRGRKGKRTAGHAGDLCSTGSQSAALFRMFAFELKCGYQHVTINDLVDRPKTAAFQKDGWDGWIHQAAEAAEMSGSVSWMIIHARSRGQKRVMMYMNAADLEMSAPKVYEDVIGRRMSVLVDATVRKPGKGYRRVSIIGLPFHSLVYARQSMRNSFRDAVINTVSRKRREG